VHLRPIQLVLALALAAVAAATACSSSKREVGSIRVGMSQQELTALLGEPLERRAPTKDASGRVEEIWLYDLGADVHTGKDVTVGVLKSGVGFFEDPTAGRRHAFVFVGGQLVRWGEAKGEAK